MRKEVFYLQFYPFMLYLFERDIPIHKTQLLSQSLKQTKPDLWYFWNGQGHLGWKETKEISGSISFPYSRSWPIIVLIYTKPWDYILFFQGSRWPEFFIQHYCWINYGSQLSPTKQKSLQRCDKSQIFDLSPQKC